MNGRPTVIRYLRMMAVAWWLQIKVIATSAFDGVLQVVWPLFFATAALLVYHVSHRPGAMLYAALGASMMGMWSTIATTASTALQRERMLGTLELMVSSPTPFALTLLPITMAMASVGLYSLVATLLWSWLVFRVPLHIANPVAFVVCVVAAIGSMAIVGFLLSASVVRYRAAWALGNMLEYPGWVLCGFVVPITLFPNWVRGISYILPPTWGVRAIREAAAGTPPWESLGICIAIGIAYTIVAVLLAGTVLRSARRHASLSLS